LQAIVIYNSYQNLLKSLTSGRAVGDQFLTEATRSRLARLAHMAPRPLAPVLALAQRAQHKAIQHHDGQAGHVK